MVTMRAEVRKEIIWACIYAAIFFAVGGLIGFVSGGGDHFRAGQIVFSVSEWAQIRQEQWGSFWQTGLLAIPCGLGIYGAVFLIRAMMWRFKHQD